MECEEQTRRILSQVAKEYGVTTETVLDEINQIIEQGIHSEDMRVRMRWEGIPRAGTVPTAAELIAYCVNQVQSASVGTARKYGFLRVVK